MANWFKSLFSRGTEINNQTIDGDVQQADTINNQNTTGVHVEGNISGSHVAGRDIHINHYSTPKKIIIAVLVLLVLSTVASFVWRGNFFFQKTTGDQSPVINAGRDVTVQYGISEDKLIELAEKLGVVKSERDAWMQKYKDLEKQLASRTDDIAKRAKAFLDKGDLEQAKKLFKQSLANDLKNAAANAFALAQIEDLQYNTTEAIAYYQQGVQLDPDNADGWNRLGHLLYRTGELDNAIAAYQTVLKLGQAHQDQEKIAWAYGNLGIVYKTRGELDKAVEMYNKALAIDEQMGNKQGMAEAYGNLGIVYKTRGELDKAVEMYQKILKIHEELGHKEGLAADYGNLGNVYQTRGELDKAVEMYQKILKIHEELGHKEGLAADYGNLGNVYQTRGELDKAVEMYQKSLAIEESLGRKEGMAEDYANLGIVYEKKGNKAEAKRYRQKSIELYQYLKSPNEKLVQGWLDDLK